MSEKTKNKLIVGLIILNLLVYSAFFIFINDREVFPPPPSTELKEIDKKQEQLQLKVDSLENLVQDYSIEVQILSDSLVSLEKQSKTNKTVYEEGIITIRNFNLLEDVEFLTNYLTSDKGN